MQKRNSKFRTKAKNCNDRFSNFLPSIDTSLLNTLTSAQSSNTRKAVHVIL